MQQLVYTWVANRSFSTCVLLFITINVSYYEKSIVQIMDPLLFSLFFLAILNVKSFGWFLSLSLCVCVCVCACVKVDADFCVIMPEYTRI